MFYEPLANGRAIVASEEYGPATRDADGVYRCYDHSATGALLATINYVKQTSNQTGLVYDPRLMVDSQERQLLEVQGPKGQSGNGKIIGFGIADVPKSSDDLASIPVSLLVSGPEGNRVSVTFTMRWGEGDWKVLPIVESAETFIANRDPNLDSYELWSPEP